MNLRIFLLTTLTILFSKIASFGSTSSPAVTSAPIYKQLTANQSDSLVKANVSNPDFVILDVRTPGEYNPDHLEGAINRNYNDANFTTLLTQLNKQKIYLLHCASGSRSAQAFIAMKNQQFNEVYEMKGGISAWKSASLPTSSKFAPKLMIASGGLDTLRTVKVGTTDTVKIRITNRANDTIRFTSGLNISHPEFTTDFNQGIKLAGAQDYIFQILFTPGDLMDHSIKFTLNSNGGMKEFTINRKEINVSAIDPANISELIVYPNPVHEKIYVRNIAATKIKEYSLYNLRGENIVSGNVNRDGTIEISALPDGVYLLKLQSDYNVILQRKIIKLTRR